MGAAQVQAMELINTAVYPIDDLGSSKARALISRCRAALKRDGICALDDFLLPAIAQKVLNACRPLIPLGTRQQGTVTPYFGKEEGLHPPGHSTNFHMSRDYVFVHGGLIHEDNPLKQIYSVPQLMEFLSRVMEKPLSPYADPFQTVNIKIEPDGGRQPFHFDSADGTITIMLQNASSGGEIEAVPNALGNEDLIGRVLRGDRKDVNAVTYAYKPGSLVLFNGTKCLHRVKECKGPRERVIGIYQFGTQPNQKACIKKSVTLYGPQILDMLDGHPDLECQARQASMLPSPAVAVRSKL